MAELTPQERIALEDIRRNNGVMWEPRHSFEATRLWAALISKGAVEMNPWTGRYPPRSIREDTR